MWLSATSNSNGWIDAFKQRLTSSNPFCSSSRTHMYVRRFAKGVFLVIHLFESVNHLRFRHVLTLVLHLCGLRLIYPFTIIHLSFTNQINTNFSHYKQTTKKAPCEQGAFVITFIYYLYSLTNFLKKPTQSLMDFISTFSFEACIPPSWSNERAQGVQRIALVEICCNTLQSVPPNIR